MSLIKRTVARNGKIYHQVELLDMPPDIESSYHTHESKDTNCYMCVNNAHAGGTCEQYHQHSPPCKDTQDLIFISEHSLKRYIKMAFIQRLQEQ